MITADILLIWSQFRTNFRLDSPERITLYDYLKRETQYTAVDRIKSDSRQSGNYAPVLWPACKYYEHPVYRWNRKVSGASCKYTRARTDISFSFSLSLSLSIRERERWTKVFIGRGAGIFKGADYPLLQCLARSTSSILFFHGCAAGARPTLFPAKTYTETFERYYLGLLSV